MDRQRPLAYRLVQDRYPSIVLDKTIKEKNEHVDERKSRAKNIKKSTTHSIDLYVGFSTSTTAERTQITFTGWTSALVTYNSILARITGYTFRTGRTVFEAKMSR